MRLDKYLKVSRIIKRRTVANEACDAERVVVNGKTARASYEVKMCIRDRLGHTLPWGMLTGVRPVKLVRQMTEVGMTEADVMQKLSDYGVSEERAQLSMDTWHNQRRCV